MVFVMRLEPTHIIISAQQMWNKAMQRSGRGQAPTSPGSVLKEQEQNQVEGAFPRFCELSFPPFPTSQGHPDWWTSLLQPEPCSQLSAPVLGQDSHPPDQQQPQMAPLSLTFSKLSWAAALSCALSPPHRCPPSPSGSGREGSGICGKPPAWKWCRATGRTISDVGLERRLCIRGVRCWAEALPSDDDTLHK